MKKIYYLWMCLSAVVALVFYSCVREYLRVDSDSKNSKYLSVDEVKKLFESQIAHIHTRSGHEDGHKYFLSPGDYTPLWDKSIASNDDKVARLSFPLLSDVKYRAIRSEIVGEKAIGYVSPIQQRLVAVSGKNRDNHLAIFIETAIPDRESAKRLKSGGYEVHSKEFSGIVICQTTQGCAVNYGYFKEGKLAGGVYMNPKEREQSIAQLEKFRAAFPMAIQKSKKIETRSLGYEDDDGCSCGNPYCLGGCQWPPSCFFCLDIGCHICLHDGDCYFCGQNPCGCGLGDSGIFCSTCHYNFADCICDGYEGFWVEYPDYIFFMCPASCGRRCALPIDCTGYANCNKCNALFYFGSGPLPPDHPPGVPWIGH